jgi:hypothetical protein
MVAESDRGTAADHQLTNPVRSEIVITGPIMPKPAAL